MSVSSETVEPNQQDGCPVAPSRAPGWSFLEVLGVALRLGLTSFGGPIAHVAYFRNEYVVRRRWLDEATFADLVALTQTLPGPASSELGIAIGILRAGVPGAFAAWLGFTLPSAIALTGLALIVQSVGPAMNAWLSGLRIVAVAVIAMAVWGMARSLAADRQRGSVAIAAAIATLAWPEFLPAAASQVAIIVLAGLVGWRWLPSPPVAIAEHVRVPIGRPVAVASAVLFFVLLFGLPVVRQLVPGQGLALFDSFFRVGSLVFGGGHVVLPLLEAEVVQRGWVEAGQFLVGYGAAQAVPGPLFTFAAYVGAVMPDAPNGTLGASIALGSIFLPAFLFVFSTLPSWGALRTRADVQSALRGINAAVVGLLLAALYQSAWVPAIKGPREFALALAAFGALAVWRLPPWLVVAATTVAGAFFVRVI